MQNKQVLYLIRHGITDHNVAGVVQGELDSKLTENGIKYSTMAAKVVSKLDGQKDFRIFSSPLMRTRQTAEIICQQIGAEIVFDSDLIELKRGIIEGKNKDSFNQEDLRQISEFKSNPWKNRITGGESYTDLYDRCKRFIVEHNIRSFETNTIIVSHGFTIRMLLLIINAHPLHYYDQLKAPHNLIYRISLHNDAPQIETIDV